MIEARIASIGLLGPGLTDWPAARRILAGTEAYVPAEVSPPVPEGLSPRERRRTGLGVRLAVAVAHEAVAGAAQDAAALPTVFGWAHGDGVVVQRLLETLATPERFVSPTDFHNSVHNVAVGYWAIASGSHEPCSSIAAGPDTFPASLLKALAEVRCDNRRVLHIVCGVPFNEPLNTVCPVGAPLGVAMVLAPPGEPGGIARISADYQAGAAAVTRPQTAGLRALWEINPAARAVPLLECVARGKSGTVVLPYGPGGRLSLTVAPC
ncbi:MAG: 3-oxoacyl-ACP synthase [Alphaproteobacteria bacterium]|nr:3-oxoacyl-ACP synthase [Alphaproteobacteria bacterium]